MPMLSRPVVTPPPASEFYDSDFLYDAPFAYDQSTTVGGVASRVVASAQLLGRPVASAAMTASVSASVSASISSRPVSGATMSGR